MLKEGTGFKKVYISPGLSSHFYYPHLLQKVKDYQMSHI